MVRAHELISSGTPDKSGGGALFILVVAVGGGGRRSGRSEPRCVGTLVPPLPRASAMGSIWGSCKKSICGSSGVNKENCRSAGPRGERTEEEAPT